MFLLAGSRVLPILAWHILMKALIGTIRISTVATVGVYDSCPSAYCHFPSTGLFTESKPLACIALHMHHLPPTNQLWEHGSFVASTFVLAVAELCTVHRISGRFHVSTGSIYTKRLFLTLLQSLPGYFVPHIQSVQAIRLPVRLCGLGSGEHSAYTTIAEVHRRIPCQMLYPELTLSSSNYKQRSLYGFRMSTLIGWVGGDSFKWVIQSIYSDGANSSLNRTVYFFLQSSPLQFKVCSIFQLSIDFGQSLIFRTSALWANVMYIIVIIVQRVVYGANPPAASLLADDDLEQALALEEE